MNGAAVKRGATPLAHLSAMEPWEAALIRRIRNWCHSPAGQARVIEDFAKHLPLDTLSDEVSHLNELLTVINENANRPLTCHPVQCNCAGADECVLAHLVSTASAGELHDAALVAALLVRPAQAERVAMLAAHVGENARKMTHPNSGERRKNPTHDNVVRLH